MLLISEKPNLIYLLCCDNGGGQRTTVATFNRYDTETTFKVGDKAIMEQMLDRFGFGQDR
jgi:hypothetical protein